jgi:outer membrane biosynthesis protein TonB
MTDAPAALSEQDLAAARAELAGGRLFPVWFTAAAVGVPVGGSAKIVSIGEPAEGDFVEVRPTGTKDTVFCSPNELTATRPPRRRTQKPAQKSAQKSAEEPPETPPDRSQPVAAQPPPAPKPPVRRESPAPPRDVPARNGSAPPAAEEKKPARARSGAARPVEVTVTLSSTAEGEWTVEVVTGRKRTVRPTPVQPADVAKAARVLPAAVAEAIESSLAAARQRQIERVERLRAELDAAQRALQDLSG